MVPSNRHTGYLADHGLGKVATPLHSMNINAYFLVGQYRCYQSAGVGTPSWHQVCLHHHLPHTTLETLFLAQATNTPDARPGTYDLGIAILTSKGASGVTGADFVTLAATLSMVHQLPPGEELDFTDEQP